MKRFMYLSIGVLCLMLAVAVGFHIGSQTAQAQGLDTRYLVKSYGQYNEHAHVIAITPGGDVYSRNFIPTYGWPATDAPVYNGNFWGGAPVPTEQSTWGNVKGLYDDGD